MPKIMLMVGCPLMGRGLANEGLSSEEKQLSECDGKEYYKKGGYQLQLPKDEFMTHNLGEFTILIRMLDGKLTPTVRMSVSPCGGLDLYEYCYILVI